MSGENQKKLVGYAAADQIKENSIVGIGTGSTVHFFIERLIERVQDGLTITAVSSSVDSAQKATAGGIKVVDIDTIEEITVTVDGADEIDPNWNMTKGGGGALFREKLLAVHSQEMFVIIDASKRVQKLQKHALPVEILPFFHTATIRSLHAIGQNGTVRKQKNGEVYLTDNGNYIFDIDNDSPIEDPKTLHQKLISIPGVLETGLFFDVVSKVFYPGDNGEVIEEKR